MINVKDKGALGLGAASSEADTQAFLEAAATGDDIEMSRGEFHISAGIVVPAGLKGSGADGGQTKIVLVSGGQLRVADEHAVWGGFRLASPEAGKTFVKCASSFFKFTDFVIERPQSFLGQIGFEFDTSLNSIYFTHLDDYSMGVEYPFRIIGSNMNVFNANKISGDTAYVQGFQSAITVEGQLAFDANIINGYYETGINLISLISGAMRKNKIFATLDNVTRALNAGPAVNTPNYWGMLASEFVKAGSVTEQAFFG